MVWEDSQEADLMDSQEADLMDSWEVDLVDSWEVDLVVLWDPGLVGLDFVTTILSLPIVSPAKTSSFRITRSLPGTRS